MPITSHAASYLSLAEDGSAAFTQVLQQAGERGAQEMLSIEPAVRQIVGDVRFGGDAMLLRHIERMEGRRPKHLALRPYDGEQALASLEPGLASALKALAGRARRFHQQQREAGFRYEESGMVLGQRVRPVRRAAICAPGGRSRSNVELLLSAIPAQVAGVADIVLATPEPDAVTCATAHLAGVTAIVDATGAQAVAALAYGTESVPRADVIVGAGDAYVACAKRQVFGHVNVDGLGGAPELLVLADATAQASLVAADLIAVAEQDENAWPILLTTELRLAADVERELSRQLLGLPKRATVEAAFERHGCALVVRTRERLLELADKLAVGQASLHLHRAEDAFEAIGAIGSSALGSTTPGGAGAYAGGPSLVTPVGGAARHLSALGVYHFLTRCAYVQFGAAAVRTQLEPGAFLARSEGREAQARAIEARQGLLAASQVSVTGDATLRGLRMAGGRGVRVRELAP